MRALAVLVSCLLTATAFADARPSRRPAKQQERDQTKRVAVEPPAGELDGSEAGALTGVPVDPYGVPGAPEDSPEAATGSDPAPPPPGLPARPAPAPRPTAPAAPTATTRQNHARLSDHPTRLRGQSIGAPWSGRLQNATRLRLGDGAHIRRPQRAFGTKTTVEYIRRAVSATRKSFPKAHVLAIGDLSAKDGGWLSQHVSHRSGRDVDLGLFYKRKPQGYPTDFVSANADNLDRAATWALLANLINTRTEDGGVLMIFLDYDVQGLLYKWARSNGVSEKRLGQVFQYPHGRGAAAGLVRHEPHHADHLHVRFRCAKADAACF